MGLIVGWLTLPRISRSQQFFISNSHICGESCCFPTLSNWLQMSLQMSSMLLKGVMISPHCRLNVCWALFKWRYINSIFMIYFTVVYTLRGAAKCSRWIVINDAIDRELPRGLDYAEPSTVCFKMFFQHWHFIGVRIWKKTPPKLIIKVRQCHSSDIKDLWSSFLCWNSAE